MAAVAAAALVTTAAAACGGLPAPTPADLPSPISTLPGTPGHFDNGEFSFDFPADWPAVQVGDPAEWIDTTRHIIAVLGYGTWQSGCTGGEGMPSLAPGEYMRSPVEGWMSCTGEKFGVAAGGILVEVYRWYGGPVVLCQHDFAANATLGPNAVRETVTGTLTSWEIRSPGNEFGAANNIFVMATAADVSQLAKARAIVASFRWDPATQPHSYCYPTDSPPSS